MSVISRITPFLPALSLAFVLACDGDSDDGGDEAAETGESGDESDTTMTGGKVDDDTLGPLDEDTLGDFGDDASTEDTGLTGCAVHEVEADCIAAAGCNPVHGIAVIDDGQGGWCTVPEERYIGCVDADSLCPPGMKTLCGEGEVFQTSECVPDNLSACEAPGDISGPCT